MPAVLRWRNCRFYFYSLEGNEPPHIHIDCAEKATKVWLTDLSVAYNDGFTSRELKALVEVVAERRNAFMEAWNAHLR